MESTKKTQQYAVSWDWGGEDFLALFDMNKNEIFFLATAYTTPIECFSDSTDWYPLKFYPYYIYSRLHGAYVVSLPCLTGDKIHKWFHTGFAFTIFLWRNLVRKVVKEKKKK